jgi:hypothetical protein
MTNFLIYEDQDQVRGFALPIKTMQDYLRRATAFTIFYEALLNLILVLLYSSPLCLGSFHATPLSYNLPCCGWFE